MSRSADALAAALLLAVCAVLWVPRLAGPIDLRYDPGTYYVLGTSLYEGHGYRLLNEPGAIEAMQYPPLLPMIVAAHEWLVGSRDPALAGHALRLTYAGLFFAYALAVYALARRWMRHGWALVATLLVLLNLQLLWLSDALFAELPFALVTTLFLLVAERDDRRGTAAILGGAAYLLRSSGLALLVAWVVEALWERRLLEAALRAGLAALPILVWQAYVGEVQHSPAVAAPAYAYQRAAYNFYNVTYADNLALVDAFVPERGTAGAGELARRVAANVSALPTALGESVSVRAEGPLPPVFHLRDADPPPTWSLAISRAGFAAMGLVAAAGLGMLCLDGIRLAPFYWTAALGLMVLVPWSSQFGRYLVPLAPLTAIGLTLVFANAATLVSRVVQAAVGAALGIVLTAQILALGVVFTARHEPVATTTATPPQRLFFYPTSWRLHDETLAWVAAHAERDDVVATTTPQRLYLASGLRAVFPPFEPDPAAAEHLLSAVPVRWVIVDDLDFLDVSRRYAEPALTAHPEHWRLVYDSRAGSPAGGSRVYRRIVP